MLIMAFSLQAQNNVGIGTSSPAITAKLDVTSTSQGVLLPRMTSAQREAITFPAVGLLVYDVDKGTLSMFDGIKWRFFYSTDKESELGPSELVYPVPNEVKKGDGFGEAVDISGDFAVVGSPTDTVAGLAAAGSIYIFSKKMGGWFANGKLTSPDGPQAHTQFGKSVAIDGNRLLVASPYRNSGTGAVYFYKYINGTWQYTTKLIAGDGQTGDLFGSSISVSADAMAIGASGDDIYNYDAAGSVYTYKWNINTQLWNAGAKIIATNDLQTAAQFGAKVAIENNKLLVGAPFYDMPTAENGGVAYYFYQTNNTWSSPIKVFNPNQLSDEDNFGYSVKITGWKAYISSPNCQNSNLTRGRVFNYVVDNNGILPRSLYDIYPHKDLNPNNLDKFGSAVSAHGEYFLVGISDANNIPINSGVGSGHGMVYLVNDRYIEKVLLPPNTTYQSRFGNELEMDEYNMIISEPGFGNTVGRVYIYSY